jgi:hypothetical protein
MRYALAGFAALPIAANAATFTQVVSLPTFDPYYGEAYVENIPAFDVALGTLTSLDVEVKVNFSETIPVETVSRMPFTYSTASFLTHAIARLDSGTHVDAPSVLQNGFISINSAMPSMGTASVGGSFDFTLAVDPFSAYYDPPTVVVDAYATIPNGSAFFQPEDSQNVRAGGTLTLSYTYTPVPEPVALLLVGPAIVGAVVTRRRQRIATV